MKLESVDDYFKRTVTGILEKTASELKQVLNNDKKTVPRFVFDA